MDHPQGVVVIEKFVFIKLTVIFVRYLAFVFSPDGYHAVERIHFGIRLVLIGIFFFAVFGLFHFDRVADIVGILFDQTFDPVLVEEFVVVFLVGTFFDLQNNVGAMAVFFCWGDRIALRSLGLPAPGFVSLIAAADDLYFVSHHKGSVKPYAELADDVDILFGFFFLFKGERAAFGNGAKIAFQLIPSHAAAVVRYSQSTAFLVDGEGNGKIVPGKAGDVFA